LPEYNVTAQTFSPKATTNLLRWSKDSEPEHVPSDNETQVGTGQIIALATTKDALWIACSDGVYRLSGDGGSWRVDLVAPALVLCGPRCMVNMREIIYAYTNFGFGAITDSGFVPISHSLLRVPLPGPPFSETGDIVLGRNDAEGEVLISPSSAFFSNTYVYNTLTDAFTYISDPANHFTSITAFAWQESPASGVQCTLWGKSESGSAPAYICWNSTAAYLPITVIFHPFYAGEAFTMKQWVDMTFMFINESAGYTMTATCFGSASGVGLITAPLGNEAYATFGVDRRFAMAQKIQPGLQISSITANRVFLYGVRCRYVPLTLQEGVRQ
jgi:hypothetical protein